MTNGPIIERIELTAFEIRIPNLASGPGGLGVSYVPGPGTAQLRLAVKVYAGDGLVGSYVPPRGRTTAVIGACETLAYGLIGKDALQRERHYRSLRLATKHIGEVGIGPLDIALWDLAGKFQGVSITQMLGGARDRLPTYASTMIGDREADGLSSPEAYADFAEACLALGYPAFKMHGWPEGDPAREIAMIRAVAERVGDKMGLMYDAACHLKTFADAVKVGKVCDDYGLLWLEDPYADGGLSIHGHKQLKEHVRTPILITEHLRNPETTTDILVAGASDFARADPDYDGGLTGCYKTAIAAEALGLDTEVHSCGPAMRHLMAALARSSYYEMNLVHPRTANPWSLPVYGDDYADQLETIDGEGRVPVPQRPGLGITYDWQAIEAQAVERRVIK
jgi:L-alanine-DL-glutamate epimerase-like enolase superfamily enzyme